jgi:hypothetical protein
LNAPQPGTKQALQNMLRTRHSGPNQYIPNNPVGGGGNVNMPNSQVPPFALPRQNYQVSI